MFSNVRSLFKPIFIITAVVIALIGFIGCKREPHNNAQVESLEQLQFQKQFPFSNQAVYTDEVKLDASQTTALLETILNLSLGSAPEEIIRNMRAISHMLSQVVQCGNLALSYIEEFWITGRNRSFPIIRWNSPSINSGVVEDFLQAGVMGRSRSLLLQRIQGNLVFPLSFRLALIECLRNIRTTASLAVLQRIGQEPKNVSELIALMEAIKSIDSSAFALYWPDMVKRYSQWFNTKDDLIAGLELQRLTRSTSAPDFVERAAEALVKDGMLDLSMFAYLESSLGVAAVPCYVKAVREGKFTMFVERARLAGIIENHLADSQEALDFVIATIKDRKEDIYVRNGLIQGLTEVNPLSGRRVEFTIAEVQDRIALLEKLESELHPSDTSQRALIGALKQNLEAEL